jgi:hypothetical protein
MGAWGLGPFENDGAHDLLAKIKKEGERALIQALSPPLDSEIDREDGEFAIAAAALVAAAFEASSVTDDANLEEILASYGEQIRRDDRIRQLAIEAMSQVARDGSEVLDLWEDEDQIEWLKQIQRLRRRLGESASANLAFGLMIKARAFKAMMRKRSLLGRILDARSHE